MLSKKKFQSLTTGSGEVIWPSLTTGSDGVIEPESDHGQRRGQGATPAAFYLGLCRLRGILSPPLPVVRLRLNHPAGARGQTRPDHLAAAHGQTQAQSPRGCPWSDSETFFESATKDSPLGKKFQNNFELFKIKIWNLEIYPYLRCRI